MKTSFYFEYVIDIYIYIVYTIINLINTYNIKGVEQMNKYKELKNKHQEKVNNFPMFFAFSNQQFEEGMKSLGLDPSETDKLYKAGGTGGFYLKTDAERLFKMFDNHRQEMKEARKTDDQFLFDMFNYELSNHEYVITYNINDALDALGLTIEKVNNNPKYKKALDRACKAQRDWYNLHG